MEWAKFHGIEYLLIEKMMYPPLRDFTFVAAGPRVLIARIARPFGISKSRGFSKVTEYSEVVRVSLLALRNLLGNADTAEEVSASPTCFIDALPFGELPRKLTKEPFG